MARDLALAGAGGVRSVRDPDLIEELSAAAADLPDGAAAAALADHRAGGDAAGRERSPELVLDVLALDWPRRRRGRVTTEPARVEVVVRGSVQGVGFRYFAWREAMALDLEGWVANEPDGSVRCVAQGPRDRLEAFLAASGRGRRPPSWATSRERWGPPGGALGPFAVRSGSHSGD